MSARVCYIPGLLPERPGPLGRFLPPVPEGVAGGWLEGGPPPGSWLIDPFGASPCLGVEAARLGYRVLAAVNNPIARFLLEMHANPPLESELRAALAALGAAQKGKERIEPHLRALYTMVCASCEREVEAQAFIWERGAQAPSARLYTCPHCGDHGERLASQQDAQRAAQFNPQTSTGSLHLARALERVAPLDDPDRVYAKEALETYLPRAVYALFTLVNKLDGLPDRQRKLASALLLAAFDRSNTMWAYPSARERPRVLNIPARFREINVWLALEEALKEWPTRPEGQSYTQVPLVTWPELPPESGGISVFEGRLKDLADQIETTDRPALEISAVLTTLPRPNQAFWMLSALWSGWLWGYSAAAPFKSVLRRRRYDWAWHATALYANCKNLARVLDEDIPFMALVAEVEPGFLSAAMVAAEMAGFELAGMALREKEGQAQIHWRKEASWKSDEARTKPLTPQELTKAIQEAALAHLRERGEPGEYLHLHAAALSALSQTHTLIDPPHLPPAEALSQIQDAIQMGLAEGGVFRRYGGSPRNLESGLWWLGPTQADTDRAAEGGSLGDRVEMGTVNYLVKHPGCTFDELQAALCTELCGLLTPEREMIEACLESYGEPAALGAETWQLRPEDAPRARRVDLRSMRTLLHGMGEKLGYNLAPADSPGDTEEISPLEPLIWVQGIGEPAYIFYVLASAVFGRIVFPAEGAKSHAPDEISRAVAAPRRLMVIPGGRAGLVRYKLARNPRLAEAIESGWEFVKFRHLRRLSESTSLIRASIGEKLLLDPLASDDPQMSLW